ncbi:MAG: FKBP-type peptidyl-prolyl cis-trans isomerase [Bacteroidales bacterium]|nr:FKBP-type peptidyl-prolyl cis-trans isomerase [Bacteroidales bacterium]
MKKSMKMAAMLVAATTMMVACNGGDKEGFKKTDNGLYYKFVKENPDGEQVHEGDVLVGELTIRFDTTVIFSNKGEVRRIAQATPNYEIKIGEGLLMMHVGDEAVFAMDADSAAKYVDPQYMPPTYEPGKGQKLYYEINLQDIVTLAELEEERANFDSSMEQRKASEPDDIAAYVKSNNITAKPNADGLYVIVKKRGTGAKVATGKVVSMNYTGRLLDGTIFDSSVESDARAGEIYNANRKYEPMTYTVGKDKLIEGWEQGVMGQPEGTTLQLIIPSALAYGPRQMSAQILPYSTLVFDIEIVSVK